MRNPALALVCVAACALATPAAAARLVKGSNVVWVGLNGNVAQLLDTATGISPSGELGVHVALNRFLSDAWTMVVSGGVDAGSSKLELAAGGGTFKATSSSFNVRVGGDRYAFINDDVALYAGPGVLFWKGHAEFESPATPKDKEPDVTQVGLNGRLGMYARLSNHVALFGHIGQVLATNSAKSSNGDKYTWWSNHHEGSVGLAFDF